MQNQASLAVVLNTSINHLLVVEAGDVVVAAVEVVGGAVVVSEKYNTTPL